MASPITFFTLITYTGHSGVFGSITHPPINYPGHWVDDYGAAAFVLKAVI